MKHKERGDMREVRKGEGKRGSVHVRVRAGMQCHDCRSEV